MGTYYIPRNLKGESRILYFFTVKSLISTACGVFAGLLFLLIFSALGMKLVGLIITGIFALIGFAVGTFKIPTLGGFPITQKIGGEPITEIISRWIKFKKNKKMYVYTKEEE